MKRILPAVAVVLTLAACSAPAAATAHTAANATAAHSAPPSAMTLLQRVAGVTQCAPETPDPEDLTLAGCESADGSFVELATFASPSDEMQWLQAGGAGAGPPDPSYAGCCIQGNGWAATVGAPDYVDTGSVPVIAALGGRVVNG